MEGHRVTVNAHNPSVLEKESIIIKKEESCNIVLAFETKVKRSHRGLDAVSKMPGRHGWLGQLRRIRTPSANELVSRRLQIRKHNRSEKIS